MTVASASSSVSSARRKWADRRGVAPILGGLRDPNPRAVLRGRSDGRRGAARWPRHRHRDYRLGLDRLIQRFPGAVDLATSRGSRPSHNSNPNLRQTAILESQRVGFRCRAGAEYVMDVNCCH